MRSFQTGSTATRGDLLQVQSGSNVVPAHPDVMLERMGFRVAQLARDHWIVTGVDPLPEFHFYTRLELGRFALNQASQYQEWLNWRQHHDKTAHLSG
ncbi:hypothetical protein ACFOZ5_02090 [Marinobacter lacisalsi]|uniref:Uncharacterized protein n=1 Tax=Marinobacter lacisalsi TaxID=475979 RepID=A0ABV8QBT3_9GAMM